MHNQIGHTESCFNGLFQWFTVSAGRGWDFQHHVSSIIITWSPDTVARKVREHVWISWISAEICHKMLSDLPLVCLNECTKFCYYSQVWGKRVWRNFRPFFFSRLPLQRYSWDVWIWVVVITSIQNSEQSKKVNPTFSLWLYESSCMLCFWAQTFLASKMKYKCYVKLI